MISSLYNAPSRRARAALLSLFALLSAAPLMARGGKDRPPLPADIDPESLPRIGVASLTVLSKGDYIHEDAEAIRGITGRCLESTGLFIVEADEYTDRVLERGSIFPGSLYQKDGVIEMNKSSLNYIVIGSIKITRGRYLVTLNLLDLKNAIFSLKMEGRAGIDGRRLRFDVERLALRFARAINTNGYVVKRPEWQPYRFEYEIGERGPGGGVVFFKKGSAREGWRYLEVAPAYAELRCAWGFFENGRYGPDGLSTSPALGDGLLNTRTIEARMESLDRNDSAAQAVRRLTIGGLSDWFLPSLAELRLVWEVLASRGGGGFAPDPYWTSSQSDFPYVWFIDFRDGKQYHDGRKQLVMRVRPIRAF